MRMIWLAAAVLWVAPLQAQPGTGLPKSIPVDGFKQLLPHGGIPALVDPLFVAADKAGMPEDAWILGFAIGEHAFAYDLNLLNHHEIVNHTAGELPIAAVW
ncbi:MAG: DUF3179 domain-containing protein [Gemmatimonadetes bacterium]|jgi:hypothetical protein|nr:DUF3179 domain-containing protein [Gemmatimonadota bacterium]MBT6146764.1 DUF3179 domain-containing protein [Gemmatimonadota bacterium]MBT7859307.1 DUF3179 domain-containing protein [Gemmatimonadota bacterium]